MRLGKRRLIAGATITALSMGAALPSAATTGPRSSDGSAELIEFDVPIADPVWRETVRARSIADRPARVSGQVEAITGVGKLPVALVDFSDNQAASHLTSQAYRDMLFKKDHPIGAGSLADYFSEQSGGLFNVQGTVSSQWYRMPRTYATYEGAENGLQVTQPNAETLARDAAVAMDADVNFCEFDTDGDGFVDVFTVIHAGPGAEETASDGPGSGQGIWSHMYSLWPAYTTNDTCSNGSRVKIGTYTMQPAEHLRPEDAAPGAPTGLISIGVFVHEFAHAIGLRDLYDIDYSSGGGVGTWDVMAAGAYGFDGLEAWRPTPLGAFNKVELGWAIPKKLRRDTSSVTFPSSDKPRTGAFTGIYQLFPQGRDGNESFLVEARSPESPWSARMPSGLLVWRVNEANRRDDNSDNADDTARLVEVVEADGIRSLGAPYRVSDPRGNSGDMFPGATNRTFFDSTTAVNSRLANGSLSSIALRDIAMTSTGPIADLFVYDGLDVPAEPTGLSARMVGGDVTVDWTPSSASGITEQRVYRSLAPDGAGTRVGTVSSTATSFTDTSAPSGETVYYTVRAMRAGVESPPSNEVSIAVPLTDIAPIDYQVLLGTATGALSALTDVDGIAATFESKKKKKRFRLDYDLIFDAPAGAGPATFEITPLNTIKFNLFAYDWVAGNYQVLGSFKVPAGVEARFPIPGGGRLFENGSDGEMFVGIAHVAKKRFKHRIDRAVLTFD